MIKETYTRPGPALSVLGALVCLAATGCPVPAIYAPDFTLPSPATDLTSTPSDGGGGDGGAGANWATQTPAGVSTALRGLWANSTDTFAVGDDGVVLHRSGAGPWAHETTPQVQGLTPNLYGVAGLQNGDLLAVGSGGAVLRRSAGTGQWAPESVPAATATLYAIATLTSGDTVAVGDNGLVVVYSGAAWSKETTPGSLESLILTGVSSGAANDAYAVGNYYNGSTTAGVILRRGVGTWAQDPGSIASANQVPFYAVTVAGGAVYVAGIGALVLKQAGAAWTPEKTVLPSASDGGSAAAATSFEALIGAADGTLIAAGSAGGLQVRSGSTLQWTTDHTGVAFAIHALSGTWPTPVAVGDNGFIGQRL